jgi:hypothetical protein
MRERCGVDSVDGNQAGDAPHPRQLLGTHGVDGVDGDQTPHRWVDHDFAEHHSRREDRQVGGLIVSRWRERRECTWAGHGGLESENERRLVRKRRGGDLVRCDEE